MAELIDVVCCVKCQGSLEICEERLVCGDESLGIKDYRIMDLRCLNCDMKYFIKEEFYVVLIERF